MSGKANNPEWKHLEEETVKQQKPDSKFEKKGQKLEIETKKTFNKSKIKLNVSGSLFVTSYTTLTSIPGTYFSGSFCNLLC